MRPMHTPSEYKLPYYCTLPRYMYLASYALAANGMNLPLSDTPNHAGFVTNNRCNYEPYRTAFQEIGMRTLTLHPGVFCDQLRVHPHIFYHSPCQMSLRSYQETYHTL